MSENKDVWDKVLILSTMVSAVAIPIIAGFYTYLYSYDIQNRSAKVQELQLIAELIPLLTSKDEKVKNAISEALLASKLPLLNEILCKNKKNEGYVGVAFRPPSERVGGMHLAWDEIAGYKISYGPESGKYSEEKIVDLPFAIIGPVAGEKLYVTVQTIDAGDRLSEMTPEMIFDLSKVDKKCF